MWLLATANSHLNGQISHLVYYNSTLQPSLKTVQNRGAKFTFFLLQLYCLCDSPFTFSSETKSQLLSCIRKTYITFPAPHHLPNVCLHSFYIQTLHNDIGKATCNLTYVCLVLYTRICVHLQTGGFTLYHIAIVTCVFPSWQLSAPTRGSRFWIFSFPTPFQPQVWAIFSV